MIKGLFVVSLTQIGKLSVLLALLKPKWETRRVLVGGLSVNGRAIISNMFTAFFAQGVSLLLSILQSLIIPKMLGVTQFGYWQLYLFYVSYVGFFHLGLSSGIYLKMGGVPRDEMDKGSVKSQFVFGVTYQTIMALVIIAASYLFGSVPSVNS
ncbi:hypothetical protein OZX57_01690 [Bifidobacterium sp. ESL0682]|uniref:hypothetical protein n=1 Tax=Bifidobacterium sp. ESL0682 TaxID=2983212 RepID=UPI0023F66558|nr:hypothetical protein [Bifidobacterium sp. ESL0682]WEV42229.1 hypothetical protein OZX57_01690 [Bifidobacterium sp. ESL0682]